MKGWDNAVALLARSQLMPNGKTFGLSELGEDLAANNQAFHDFLIHFGCVWGVSLQTVHRMKIDLGHFCGVMVHKGGSESLYMLEIVNNLLHDVGNSHM